MTRFIYDMTSTDILHNMSYTCDMWTHGGILILQGQTCPQFGQTGMTLFWKGVALI